ncbi:hypothetical protein FQA39_LY12914 [Lamprigera yunnana]|nr:hypothetical protein FQA39_LY12914 [Lamprigera yunnana]
MNYYDEMINEIKELIKNQEFGKALKIIQTELDMPYIPNDIEKQLVAFQKELTANDVKNTRVNFSIDKIKEMLLSTDEVDQALVLQYIEELQLKIQKEVGEINPSFATSAFTLGLKSFLQLYPTTKHDEVNQFALAAIIATSNIYNNDIQVSVKEADQEKITIEKNDYCEFNDYNDLMINAFEIGCSLCGESEILFVLKNSPKPIGRLLKDLNKDFDDDEIEKILEQPIKQ